MASSRRTGTNESRWTGSEWASGVNTFAASGADYSDLSVWESDTGQNLVTATRSAVLECAAGTYTVTSVILFWGADTNSSYMRIVRANSSSRHGGIPGVGAKFLSTTGSIQFAEHYLKLHDLEFVGAYNSADALAGFQDAGYGYLSWEFVGLLASGSNSGSGIGCGCSFVSGHTYNVIANCVFYGSDEDGCVSTTYVGGFYNCSAINNGRYGFTLGAGTSSPFKDCIGYGNATADYYGTFPTGTTHNLSSDATAPAVGVYYRSKSLTFENVGADNYDLVRADSDAIAQGANLSADGTFAFNDDIAFSARGAGQWDVGAFAYTGTLSSRRRGTNEDIKTFGDTGFSRDYTALATWETDTDIDLVSAAQSKVVECYADAASYAGQYVVYADAVANALYHRILRAASTARHLGVPGAGIVLYGSAFVGVDEDYFSVQDIEINNVSNDIETRWCVRLHYGSGGIGATCVGCLVSAANNGSGVGEGIYLASVSAPLSHAVVNCVAHDCDDNGIYGLWTGSFIYNCTSIDNGVYGFSGHPTQTWYVSIYKNNIGYSNATADFLGDALNGTTHNLSGDATAPAAGTYYRSKTLYFMAAQGRTGDYRIAPADLTNAQGKATSLSTDGAYPFDDDIAFNLRSGAWDLGASNYAPAGGSRRTGLNEQISTFGDTGFGRDYTSVYTWEDTTDVDLVAARECEVLECYKDAASYAIGGFGFLGATTSHNYFRLVRAVASARHLGVPGTGVKFVPSGYWISQDGEAWLGIEDLEFAVAWNSTGDGPSIFFNGTAPYSRLVGLIVSATNAGTGVASGVASTDGTVNIINCVVHDCEGYGIAHTLKAVYSCTAVSCGTYGFDVTGGAGYDPERKNCIGYGCGTVDFRVSTGYESFGTNNLSEDTTAPGTVNYRNKSLTFEDAANGNYALVLSDIDAINRGISLLTDATFPFNDDIAFTTRPVAAEWDVGAFEYSGPFPFKHFIRRWRW